METFVNQDNLIEAPTNIVVNRITGFGISEEKANGFILFFQEYQQLKDQIKAQEAIVAEWETKPRCYGTKSFKKRVYLHINHSPVQYRKLGECPHCGWGHDTHKRHYPYVGKDPIRQDEAITAMKNWQHWEEQKKILAQLKAKLSQMDRLMTSLLSSVSNQKRLL